MMMLHEPLYEPHTSIDIPSVEKGNKIIPIFFSSSFR